MLLSERHKINKNRDKITDNSVNTYFILILVLLLSFGIVGAALIFSDKTEYTRLESGWTDQDNNEIDIKHIGKDTYMYNKLPEIKNGDKLFIRTNTLISLYIDNQFIGEYGRLEMVSPYKYKSPSSYFELIDLKEEYSNKTIEIDMITKYSNSNSNSIKDLIIGDYKVLLQQISDKLFGFSCCIMIIILGIIAFILAITLRKYNDNSYSLIYLGIFALVFGTYSLTETMMLQLITGNSNYWHVVTNTSFMFLAPPIFMFIKNRYTDKVTASTWFITITTVLCFIVSCVLHIFRIKDFKELVPLSQAIIIVGAIFTIYYAIRCLVASKFRDISFIGLTVVAISSVADIILYNNGLVKDNSNLTRLSVFVYIALLTLESINVYMRAYDKSVQNEMIAKTAYYDIVTGLFNRTSYIDATKEIRNKNRTDTVVMVFDINNLKYVNDFYGHSIGDEAIVEASKFITKYFGEYGDCYRTGGDEFVLLSTTKRLKDSLLIEKKTEFEAALVKRNIDVMGDAELSNNDTTCERKWVLLVALGYAKYGKDDFSIDSVINRADAMMYNNKRELKERYPEMNLR